MVQLSNIGNERAVVINVHHTITISIGVGINPHYLVLDVINIVEVPIRTKF